ncbi:hypothetical protein Clacol_006740 [Clathrus columnatus]|uniref:Uncharacterized protein n=1 Tax=Clathrus columnatus TaxID=1419009 RepID=A0AAV5ACX6_9AGAM|nr:hypothetical protein Clacol_006740 [Clathrus columnatus]
MLLRLTTGDPLNSFYSISSDNSPPVYTILTRSALTKPPYVYYKCLETDDVDEEKRRSSKLNLRGSLANKVKEELWEKSWLFPLDKFVDGSPVPEYCQGVKHLWLLNSQDDVLAELIYNGTTFTAVKLCGKGTSGPMDLFFGICKVEKDQFRARLDIGDLEWIITREGLQLISDDENQTILMKYHTGTRRTDQKKPYSPKFMKGETFLEVNEFAMRYVDKVEEAQILATFCMMEITRRTLFNLLPYEFFEEATLKVNENNTLIRLQKVLRRMRSMHLL